jgi:PhnB protein
MSVHYIPDGFHTVTPYLVTRGVARLIEFLTGAFGAVERDRTVDGSGRIMNAIVQIGDSMVMMGEGSDKYPVVSTSLHLYLPDADETYRRALEAGATSVRPPADQFYGDRTAGVQDPSGNTWWISTRVEAVSPEEMERRLRELPPGAHST